MAQGAAPRSKSLELSAVSRYARIKRDITYPSWSLAPWGNIYPIEQPEGNAPDE